MNLNQTKKRTAKARGAAAFRSAWARSCQKVLGQIRKVKEAIFAEARHAFETDERLLRLALNEAEALAWQTSYPHLLFPVLATEKIRATADWNDRQQSVRRSSPKFVYAAECGVS